MKVRIKKLTSNAIMPTKATDGAAAYDLYVPYGFGLGHGRAVIRLGLAIEVPKGYEAKIEPRSGYASKGFEGFNAHTNRKRYNCDVIVGKIDSDYRGEIGVIVNNNDVGFTIKKGQRIAQLSFYKVEDAEFIESEDLSRTKRGTGGFGSTGSY